MKKPRRSKTFGKFTLKTALYIALSVAALIVIFQFSDASEDKKTAAQAYTSLDLRIAAQAVYNGSPLKTVSQLGPDHGIKRAVINFSVPAAGLSEYGLMTTPSQPAPPGGYPVIVLVHGYIQPAAYSTKKAYLGDMEFYAQHGFVVIKPDLRGQGMSIKQGRPEGAYYSMAYNTDILSLLASIKHTSGFNTKSISLWGHSMGAYLALRAAVLSPDIKDVILLSGPVGDVEDMYDSYIPKSDIANPVAYKIRKAVLKQYGTPLTNSSFWYYTSPINFLNNTHAFIQIHVGAKDQVVPPKLSADLNLALNQLNLPHGYYVYPDAGHGLVAERSQIYAHSLQALQK
jgi:dipeptidyl aminopeptidase/acylaminoacyl peptidase